MREIVPHKMVISYEDDGTVKNAILQYRIREDGVLGRDFSTMSVKPSIEASIQVPMDMATGHVEVGEGLKTEDQVELELQNKAIAQPIKGDVVQ